MGNKTVNQNQNMGCDLMNIIDDNPQITKNNQQSGDICKNLIK